MSDIKCDVCSTFFDPDVTGIRCRDAHGTCRAAYCQLCGEIDYETTVRTDKYLCTMCRCYSCRRHGHACDHPDCGHMMCDVCEFQCIQCHHSYCAAHIVLPALREGERRTTLCRGCAGRKREASPPPQKRSRTDDEEEEKNSA